MFRIGALILALAFSLGAHTHRTPFPGANSSENIRALQLVNEPDRVPVYVRAHIIPLACGDPKCSQPDAG